MEASAGRGSFSRYDIRVIIKFLVLSKKMPTEIHEQLHTVIGHSTPSIQTVRKWVVQILEGRDDMEDEERSGRPKSARTEANVDLVKLTVEEDKRRTCEEVEEITGIPHSTVHRILVEELGKKKIFAKWVPHLLTEEQRQERVRRCRANLRRYRKEGADFLDRIVSGDETWVYSWDPELKSQSAQWRNSGSPRPEKARRKQGAVKVMHIVFFDSSGVLVNWPVPKGTTVNAAYYKWFLQEKLRPAIRKKRPGLMDRGIIFHHDNAPVHTARLITDFLDTWNAEMLEHPRYSPDLAPADFCIFPKMKESLRGRRFESPEDIVRAARASLQHLDDGTFHDAFQSLVRRWQKCLDIDGQYVE